MTSYRLRKERFDCLAGEVWSAGGILQISVGALRRLDGSGAAKHGVVARIESELATRGLGSLPQKLPRDQDALVQLFSIHTDAGRLISSALRLAKLDVVVRPEAQATA